MYKKCLCFFLVIILISSSVSAAPAPSIYSEGAILIEPQTNTILYAKNANQRFFPASTTKVLTALILLEDLPLTSVITKSKASIRNVPVDSSQIGLKIGDEYSALEGLYAVLMASDNYVCYDMAVKDAKSQKAFADKMNEKAQRLGALSSHFVNSHGYHHLDHYTTPFDLSQIAKSAFDNPMFVKIAGAKTHSFVTKNSIRSIPLKHTALLLDETSPYYNIHVIGAKTGFHTPAKRTLIAKAKYDNIELIGVVMKTSAPHQFEDMNALFDYGQKNFSLISSEDGNLAIDNHTYSPWAKPYIQYALDNAWIERSSKNYTELISKREFINLLKGTLPEESYPLLDRYLLSSTDSIYKENLPASASEIAQICYDLFYKINPSSTYTSMLQNNDSEKKGYEPYKDAFNFAVENGIFSYSSSSSAPKDTVTYEQALAIIYNLYPFLSTYSLSLSQIS